MVKEENWEEWRALSNEYNTSPPHDQWLKFTLSVNLSLAAQGDSRADTKENMEYFVSTLEKQWEERISHYYECIDMSYGGTTE